MVSINDHGMSPGPSATIPRGEKIQPQEDEQQAKMAELYQAQFAS
jgi:hypothetical protein